MDDPEGKRRPTIDEVVRVRSSEGNRPAARALPSPRAAGHPPRIEEVARLAGVSPITVSRALRHPEKVAEPRRRQILEVIAHTGYSSNPYARALRSGRSTIVAAFVSNVLSQQYSLAVQGCAEVLEPYGYQLLVGQTSYSYAREVSMIQSLRALRPAAALFTGVIELEENRDFLRGFGVPIVEMWAYPRDPIDMLVGFSNFDGGAMAAAHLAECGYRRVAFIGRSGGRGVLRLTGFRAGAAELGLAVTVEHTVASVTAIDDGRHALREVLNRDPGVEAVFCANDLLAIGALSEARRMGRRIPGDIAVLGFGDNDFAEEIPPGLSTIAVDGRDLGRRAGRLLLARLRGAPVSVPVEVVELAMVRRGST